MMRVPEEQRLMMVNGGGEEWLSGYSSFGLRMAWRSCIITEWYFTKAPFSSLLLLILLSSTIAHNKCGERTTHVGHRNLSSAQNGWKWNSGTIIVGGQPPPNTLEALTIHRLWLSVIGYQNREYNTLKDSCGPLRRIHDEANLIRTTKNRPLLSIQLGTKPKELYVY